MKQCLRRLKCVLKNKGALCDPEKDFSDKAEFHGVLVDLWSKQRELDPAFGCQPNEAECMTDADERMKAAIDSGKLNLHDPKHLQLTAMFLTG